MASVTWSNKKASLIPASVEIAGMFSNLSVGDKAHKQLVTVLGAKAKTDLAKLNFTGKQGSTVLVPGQKRPVLVVGLGDSKKLNANILRRATASAVRAVSGFKTAVLSYGDTAASVLTSDEVATALYEGLALGSYTYSAYKDSNKNELTKVTISDVTKSSTVSTLRRSTKVCDAIVWARDAINTPPNDKAPATFARKISDLFKSTSVKVTVLSEAEIRRQKMAGVIAVGQGSENPPSYVRLSYKSPGAKKTLAFVGKGVVFDSGGLSIKPGDAMKTMKCDMSGAAAVAGALKAIAGVKPNVNVEGYIPLVENMPSGSAYRVDDIIRYKNGVTAEIQNTDAEGRLILADGLIDASSGKPDGIVNLATLTGACVIALGNLIAAAMGNDDKLIDKVLDAGDQAGERLWELPLPDDYRELIDTPVANVANAGPRVAGTITAGLFLREFVNDVPWVHLDIAGPAFLDSTDGENTQGGTGFGIRTLVQLAENFS